MKNVNLSVLLCIVGLATFGQHQTHKHTETVNEINVIVLDLGGNATLGVIHSNEIHVNTYLSTYGYVYGMQFPDERPVFETTTKRSNDTLFVFSPKSFSYKTIGISTYKETVEAFIRIPVHCEVIVRKASNLVIEPGFKWFEVEQANQINIYNTKKNQIREMYCESNNLLVNGYSKGNRFEFHGKGNDAYLLKANNIELTLK